VAPKAAATENTLYPIASLTKPIAAVVLFQLLQAGKLNLDARMATILKDYRFNARILGYAARCEDIVGLATLDDPEIAPYRALFQNYQCRTAPITVRHHLTHMAQHRPGSAFRYNGFLFGMLAPVAEAASGRSFWNLVNDGVLAPAGMRQTTFSPDAGLAASPDLAQSYARDSSGAMVPSTCRDCSGLNAGSGLVATAPDLARFIIALEAGALLPDSLRRAMLTPARTDTGQRSPYAHGWFVQEINGVTAYWHYGHLPGAYSGLLITIPQRQIALVLLGTSDALSADFGLGAGDLLRSPFGRAFLAATAHPGQ
jgi:CubicO group peptidase (beta-lactamase class C family)